MRTARLLPVSPSMHCSWGGVPAVGVPARGGTCPGTPLWTEFLTHATENITLPHELRVVDAKVKFYRQVSPVNQ